jgi:hypothetical protein
LPYRKRGHYAETHDRKAQCGRQNITQHLFPLDRSVRREMA